MAIDSRPSGPAPALANIETKNHGEIMKLGWASENVSSCNFRRIEAGRGRFVSSLLCYAEGRLSFLLRKLRLPTFKKVSCLKCRVAAIRLGQLLLGQKCCRQAYKDIVQSLKEPVRLSEVV